MTDSREERLLYSLVTVLVEEWGADAVRVTLDDIADVASKNYSDPRALENQKPRKYLRPSAREVANRITIPSDRKDAILTLSERFDSKTFLPTISDVRHFFEMQGLALQGVKHRKDALRQILDVLVTMPLNQLGTLLNTHAYSGPTELGPLSNAISASGAALRTPDAHGASDEGVDCK